ncbi:MAG: fasciclin domain-containing protein [Comamonadaceae bacterium]|nr:MAG: fasciclin domain-containing protein [Comamonadaceae bacterium]
MFNRRNLSLATAAIALTVLAGCATPRQAAPVGSTIAARSELSALSGMLAKAGLTDTLNGAGNFTVFAPSNDAFAKLPAKTRDALAADPALLKSTLTYHVLPVKVMAADVKNGNAKTVNGADVALSKAGTYVTVEEAMVVVADIPATNGVVHVVDTVLIPPVKR